MRPFRFAIQGGPFTNVGALREHASLVESLGYDELFSFDHVRGGSPDPFGPLLIAAEATERLRVGPLVLNNEFHHPALLARTALSADQMSGGRLILGMGTGYAQGEHDALGLRLLPPAARVTRFAECLHIVRCLLDDGACRFEGEHHQVDIDDFGLASAQNRVPLLIGGHGPRVVSLAGRYADIFQFTGLTHGPDGTPSGGGFAMKDLLERARWLSDAAAEREGDIERSALVQFTAVGAEAPTASDMQARFRRDAAVIEETPFVLAGTVEQLVDKLERIREQLGINHFVVREPETFAPVVDALAGR